MRLTRLTGITVAALFAGSARAQATAPAATPQDAGPKVGDVAPDFTLPGATKAGKLSQPVHLADLKGQVVVLAFFPKARTSG